MESSDKTPAHNSRRSNDPPSPPGGKGVEEQEVVSSTGCGWRRFRPKILAPFAHVWTFIILYIAFAFTHAVQGSYPIAVLTTLERRFNLSSFLAGVIVNMSVFGYIISIIVFSFFLSKTNKPRLFAVCMVLTATGAFLYFLPHIVLGSGYDAIDATHAQSTNVNATPLLESGSGAFQLCRVDGGSNGKKTKAEKRITCSVEERETADEDVSHVVPAVAILCMADFVHGIAAASIWTVGLVFIDDHTLPQLSAKLIGLMYTVRLISPIVSFAMGGYLLSIHTSLRETNLTPKHPQWIGAWWMGFLINAIFNFIISIPMSMLPRNLRPISKKHSSTTHCPEQARTIATGEDGQEEDGKEGKDGKEKGKRKEKRNGKKKGERKGKGNGKVKGNDKEERNDMEKGNDKEMENEKEKEIDKGKGNDKEKENGKVEEIGKETEKEEEQTKKETKEKELDVGKEDRYKTEEEEKKDEEKEEEKHKEEGEMEKKVEDTKTSDVPSMSGEKESSSGPVKPKDAFSIEWNEFPKAIVRLVTNPIYVLTVVAICSDWSVLSFMSFMPKYFEVHFQKTASVANLLGGMIPAIFAAVSSYVGGVLTGKIKGKDGGVAGLCRMNFGVSLISVLLLGPAMLLSCHNISYSGQLVNGRLNPSIGCNVNCGCSSDVFDPVCGSDGLLYLSPCHAGCTRVPNATDPANDHHGQPVRAEECRCVPEVRERYEAGGIDGGEDSEEGRGGSEGGEEEGRGGIEGGEEDVVGGAGVVFAGFCDEGCASLTPYLLAMVTFVVFFSLYSATATTVLLRCIKEEDKSFALGLETLCICFAIFPAPLLYGRVFDASCILRRTASCTESEGSCLLYDRHSLRLNFHGLTIGLKSISTILFFVTYVIGRRKLSLLSATQKPSQTEMKTLKTEAMSL